MSAVARTGTSWDLVVRNLVMSRTRITDKTPGVNVTYVLMHKNAPYGTGTMAWEAHGHEDAWVARFLLPATPGVLVADVTFYATIDDETVTDRKQVSIQVI